MALHVVIIDSQGRKPCQLKPTSPSATTLFQECILRKLVTKVALEMEYANTQLELDETELLIFLSGSSLSLRTGL